MKRFLAVLLLILLVFSALIPTVAAQSTTSAACTSTSGAVTTFPTTITDSFFADEELTFTFTGAGLFTVNVNGNPEVVDAVDGDSFTYTIPADGSYTFEIVNTTSDPTSSVGTSCLGVDETTPDYPAGTICHIPPGNPAAAHTINVGEPAVKAHLAHGDTLGPCPAGVETKYDIPSSNIAIYILYATGEIQLYDNCDDTCDEEMNVPITLIINLADVTTGGDDDEFIPVENPEDYGYQLDGVDLTDGTAIVIYYLHPDPSDPTLGVFQINVYQNGVLVDDNVLLFITTDGNILLWTDQGYWDRQAED